LVNNLSFHQQLPYGSLPGDSLRTACGLYDHVGTVGRNGMVLASSRKFGALCEVTPYEFSGGRMIFNDGFKAQRSREQVLQHLEARLGQKYCLISANCEHQNNQALGFGYISPQLNTVLVLISGVFLLYAISRTSKA